MPNQSESTLGHKLGTLFAGGLVSKGLGLAREMALAYAFGTTFVADAFRVAMTALLFPTHFLTGEALFAAFIPTYRRLPESERPGLVRTAVTTLIGATFVLAVLVVVAAPTVVAILAPGFESETRALSARLIRIGAVGALLYAISALLVNIQIAHGQYLQKAAQQSVQNLGVLAAIVAALVFDAPSLLTLGFVAAYLAMSAWALSEVRKSPLPLRHALQPTTRLKRHAFGDFGRSVAQLSGFVVLVQASIVVDRIVASLTGEGGVAAIDYGFFISDSLRLLAAVPVATLALGQLGGRSWYEITDSLRRSIAPLIVCSIAISAYLFGLAEEIVTLVYRRGEFQELATQLTTASLRGFSLGAWAATGAYVLARAFNATLRNREVVWAGGISLAVNVVLDILLYRPLGVFGIALATSAAMVVRFAILLDRSGYGWQFIRSAWSGALGLALWILTLRAPLGTGVQRMVLAALTLAACYGVVIALSRSLREDMLWLIRRLVKR